ncbi:hypothetical protein SAMN05216262_101620 [Colwellia chukchiensis]|uniref:Uncharacterized protein n=1 Tax=Colwellia chukchiensis TaxID=641665 RepID=A0A1H7I1L6_9GAMM|nr:hypothetical protein [Colwellia chukchiensis]SEK54385.1 hypothetical protein SAMN05216262_101620 [Colwellia chukchiensis]
MKANEELFNAYVSEEFKKSAQTTKQALEQKINLYIEEFRSHLTELVKEVENTDHSEQFQQHTAQIIKQGQAASQQVDNINEIIAELEIKAPALAEQVNKLKQANKQLKTELDGIHQQATGFGASVGKFIAGSVKQIVTTGLPIF